MKKLKRLIAVFVVFAIVLAMSTSASASGTPNVDWNNRNLSYQDRIAVESFLYQMKNSVQGGYNRPIFQNGWIDYDEWMLIREFQWRSGLAPSINAADGKVGPNTKNAMRQYGYSSDFTTNPFTFRRVHSWHYVRTTRVGSTWYNLWVEPGTIVNVQSVTPTEARVICRLVWADSNGKILKVDERMFQSFMIPRNKLANGII